MGEIADALKKANAERTRPRDDAPAPGAPPHAPEDPHDAEPASTHTHTHAHTHTSTPSRHAASAAPTPPPPPTSAPTHGHTSDSAEGEPAGSSLRDRLARRGIERPDPATELDALDLPAVELDGEPPQVDLTRHLALRLKNEMERRRAHSVVITSPLRNEGKTTVSCNLAVALASVSGGHGVALVDLDLRNPSICKRLDIHVRHGIDEVIEGECRLEEACHALKAPRIDVYPCARPQHAAHELLASDGFPPVLAELCRRYEIVVIDSPPTLLVPDSTLILRHADACVALAHAGVSRVRMFTKMLSMLPAERVIGKVLNGAPAEKHERTYYAYGYGADEDVETTAPKRKRGRKTA